MVKTVVREFKWTPNVIDTLFIDDLDHHGLEYWYNDIDKMISEIKKTNPS